MVDVIDRRSRIQLAILKDLPPAYFAMVMATGTISIASHMLSMSWVSQLLFLPNALLYFVLLLFNVLRLWYYPGRFFSDLVDHQRGPGFFTSVAATCVVGAQFVLIAGQFVLAACLWVFGLLLWLMLMYTIFTAFTIKQNKPDLAHGINGSWLLAVVATQSVAVLSALLAAHWPQPFRLELNFFALSMWLWGGMLYIWMISLIFYRYAFFPFSPGDLSPPYWINMGAMAISTLAGTRLILNTPAAPFLESLLPFLKGFTVFYWATGTWWVPMLIILGCWRYVYKRYPLNYDPLYWGAVFPLAMYTLCTFSLARAADLHFLEVIPRVFIYLALAAWLAAFVGFVRRMTRNIRMLSGGLPAEDTTGKMEV